MKTKLLCIAFLSNIFFAGAQNTFVNFYGGTGSSNYTSKIRTTTDGGYIAIGYYAVMKPDSTYQNDIYVIKLNQNGDTLWTKTYGGSSDEYSSSIIQTSDGGYIIAGKTNSFGAGDFDEYVVKTNSNGDTTWTKTYGGTKYDNAHDIKQTSNGGYIILGYTASFSSSPNDTGNIYLINTDGSGNIMWTKAINILKYDVPSNIEITSDNGYMIGGYIGGNLIDTLLGDAPYIDTVTIEKNERIYLMKTDGLGNISWAKSYSTLGLSWCNDVIQTNDGGYAFAGGFSLDSLGVGCIVKTDASGSITWQKMFNRVPYSINQTHDNGYIVSFEGATRSSDSPSLPSYYPSIVLVKFTITGDTLWTSCYENALPFIETFPSYAIEAADKGYCALGYTTFGNNWVVIKTDSVGKIPNNCFKNENVLYTYTLSLNTHNENPLSNTSATIVKRTNSIVTAGGYFQNFCIEQSGIEQYASNNNQVIVYPNPASSYITISSTQTISEIKLVDILGKEVLYRENNQTAIDVSNLADGVYFVEVFTENNKYVSKFLKE
jgi:hypothetical protein